MTRVRTLLSRLRALGRQRQAQRDIDDEIASHLAEAVEDYRRRGFSEEQARQAAIRGFGGVLQTKEVYRQMQSFTWIADIPRDLRYALITLRRSPAFTATTIATLALAICANTTMFSVLNAVLLRPLPYRAPDELVMLWAEDPAQGLREGRSALWDVEQWRHRSRSLADIATLDSVAMTLASRSGAEQIAGASISPNLLPLLGIQPVTGRNFSIEEADRRERLVLISHEFWHTRFAGSPAALGETLVLDGRPAQIIGVLPAGFQVARIAADVWEAHPAREPLRGREAWFVVGRLRPGITVQQAASEMRGLATSLTDNLAAADRHRTIAVVPLSHYVVGAHTRLALWMLGLAVFGVFLIAAANVTSLSLARSAARAKEMAVRAALGANAGRIVRQVLTESLLLSGAAGVLGTLGAVGGIRLIGWFSPDNLPRLEDVSLDVRVLGCALAISVLAGILVGLAPAITTVRRNLRSVAEEGGRGASAGTVSHRIRRLLVAAEFALAVALLAGSGLLVRSWLYVTAVDPGFEPERVLVVSLSTPTTLQAFTAGEAQTVAARRVDLYRRVLDEIAAAPGVESAGLAGDLFIGRARLQDVTVEGSEATLPERVPLARETVSANFFTTLGTPLRRGRFFANSDGPESARVAIVNEALARRLWPRLDPVDRRFKVGAADSNLPWYTVVGVVADMRLQGQEREAVPQAFYPLEQEPPQSADLLIRTASDDPTALAGLLREAIARVDINAPSAVVGTLDEQLGGYLLQRRFQTALLGCFSLIALAMAAVGLYGLIHYSISLRTQEIGVRLAIGAGAGDIFRMFFGEGVRLSLTGIAIGLGGALWLGRLASGLVLGVSASDPLTFTAVSLLLAVIAGVACLVPARRAMSIEPTVAMRSQ